MFLLCLLASMLEQVEMGPGAGRCTGTPMACADVDPVSCAEQLGCRREQGCSTRGEDLCTLNASRAACESVGCMWGAGCSGIADDCASIPVSECVYQAGCAVDRQTHRCTGQPHGCGSHRDMTTCAQTRGCQWQNHCAVSIPSPRCANAHTPWHCNDLTGCAWAYMCGGRPQKCEIFTGEKTCRAQAGCHWKAWSATAAERNRPQLRPDNLTIF